MFYKEENFTFTVSVSESQVRVCFTRRRISLSVSSRLCPKIRLECILQGGGFHFHPDCVQKSGKSAFYKEGISLSSKLCPKISIETVFYKEDDFNFTFISIFSENPD